VWKEKFPAIKVVTPASAKVKAQEVINVDYTIEEISMELQQNGITFVQAQGMRLSELMYILDISFNVQAFIVTDMLFNLDQNAGVVAWLLGSTGDGVVPKLTSLMKLLGISDKVQFKRWFAEDFIPRTKDTDLLIVAHGNVVSSGLNSKLQQTIANYQ